MFTIGYITIEENIRLRREIRSYEDIYKLRYFINQVIINELKIHKKHLRKLWGGPKGGLTLLSHWESTGLQNSFLVSLIFKLNFDTKVLGIARCWFPYIFYNLPFMCLLWRMHIVWVSSWVSAPSFFVLTLRRRSPWQFCISNGKPSSPRPFVRSSSAITYILLLLLLRGFYRL